MKKCPQCAELVQDDAKVCRYCGFGSRGQKPINYGGIGCLLLVAILLYLAASGSRTDTVDTIIAADRACEAQTGKPCG